ncbi:UNVERIFIED_CONTAM: GAG-pre-integrase domain-containing protein, partial [Salmonella enterica subsp. enterica serovar Weltevreden]
LYYMENEKCNSIDHGTFLTTTSCDKIWMYHRRCGHRSFPILKFMFPEMFKGINIDSLSCYECELAKHKRVPFPPSHK